MSTRTLHLDAEAIEPLAQALQRTADDLAARALVAEDHGADLGRESARAYRADIAQLEGLLDQLGYTVREPDPHQAAVRWIDDRVYTVADDRPVAMVAQPDLSRLVDQAVERHADGQPELGDLLHTLAEATGSQPNQVVGELARRRERDRQLEHDRDLGHDLGIDLSVG